MSGEDRLLEAAKGGDKRAFERLVLPYLPMLFAYGRAICGDYHAAHDVLQQTLLITYRKLALFFPEADFGTWLRAIARREALDARKKLGRSPSLTLEAVEAFYQDPAPPGESPRRRALAECLGSLAGRMGEVVRGHYFQGLRLSELASRVGLTAAAAKQLLYRARTALRECVQRRVNLEASR
jgi:RNA polymerase sigma-70 factor (ECF subfamily)